MIVFAPLIDATTPLFTSHFHDEASVVSSAVPAPVRVIPVPTPLPEPSPQIYLFLAKPETPAAQAVPAAANVTDASPHVTFAVPKPPPVPPAEHITAAPPTYRLSPLERHLVASCLVLEAASQGEFGMRGVMAVIRNRAHGNPRLFLRTVMQEKQFSALNKLTEGRESMSRVVARAERDRMWPIALRIVEQATRSTWRDPTGGATHYTRVGEHTEWTHMLAWTVTIGRHAFYR